MSRRAIEGSYARLLGIRDAAYTSEPYLPQDIGADYQSILKFLRNEIDDEFLGFDLTQNCYWQQNEPHYTFHAKALQSKINQLIRYLEMVHRASTRVVEIGSVYNLIQDEELKSRCSDLLSATDHFDRVINQATQVLEERVRLKAPEFRGENGIALLNRAIKSDPATSKIRFSDNTSEQEGYAAIFRGLFGAFRNPSHHGFLAEVSREQALQICAFVDNMLSALNKAVIRT